MSDVAGVFLALSLSLALCVYETLRRKMCCALQYEYDRHVNVMQVLCLTWLANCIYSPFVSISLFVFDFDMGYRNEVCFYLYVCLFFVTNCAVALSARAMRSATYRYKSMVLPWRAVPIVIHVCWYL